MNESSGQKLGEMQKKSNQFPKFFSDRQDSMSPDFKGWQFRTRLKKIGIFLLVKIFIVINKFHQKFLERKVFFDFVRMR